MLASQQAPAHTTPNIEGTPRIFLASAPADIDTRAWGRLHAGMMVTQFPLRRILADGCHVRRPPHLTILVTQSRQIHRPVSNELDSRSKAELYCDTFIPRRALDTAAIPMLISAAPRASTSLCSEAHRERACQLHRYTSSPYRRALRESVARLCVFATLILP